MNGWLKVKVEELSKIVRDSVHNNPHQGRQEFLAMLKTNFPDLPKAPDTAVEVEWGNKQVDITTNDWRK